MSNRPDGGRGAYQLKEAFRAQQGGARMHMISFRLDRRGAYDDAGGARKRPHGMIGSGR